MAHQIIKLFVVGLVSSTAAYWVAVDQPSQPITTKPSDQSALYPLPAGDLTTAGATVNFEQKMDSLVLEVQKIQKRLAFIDDVLEDHEDKIKSDLVTGNLEIASLETHPNENKTQQEERLRQEMLDKIYLQREEIRINYESQNRDDTWAETMESEALDSVTRKQMLSGSNITEMDCRSSICLLKASHDDSDSAERFRMIFPGVMAGHASRINWDNNGLDTVAYIQK